MGRLIVGLLKGLLIGGGAAYALFVSGLSGLWAYLIVGLVGAGVGLIAGRAPWQAETIWTPVLKMVFGLGVSLGLFALGRRFLPDIDLRKFLPFLPQSVVLNSAPALAPAIGMLYGAFVEVDDGGEAPRLSGQDGKQKRLPRKSPPQLEE